MRKSIATISSVGRRSAASSLAENQNGNNNMEESFSPMPLNSGPESIADMSAGQADSKNQRNYNELEKYTKNAGTQP